MQSSALSCDSSYFNLRSDFLGSTLVNSNSDSGSNMKVLVVGRNTMLPIFFSQTQKYSGLRGSAVKNTVSYSLCHLTAVSGVGSSPALAQSLQKCRSVSQNQQIFILSDKIFSVRQMIGKNFQNYNDNI